MVIVQKIDLFTLVAKRFFEVLNSLVHIVPNSGVSFSMILSLLVNCIHSSLNILQAVFELTAIAAVLMTENIIHFLDHIIDGVGYFSSNSLDFSDLVGLGFYFITLVK